MNALVHFFQINLIVLITLLIGACSSPASQFYQYANLYNLSQDQLNVEGFQLQTFSNKIDSDHLNIYLDGDGSPWLRGRHPAFDPTPRSLMTLELMQQDPNAAVYIGRPCYFELGPVERCSNALWTSARYSEAVVTAIDAAIEKVVEKYRPKHVQLIGFSGGGALAVLIAARRDDINSIITVAGNLDTDLWTQIHGYLPLTGSLNPILVPSLNIPSLHLSGSLDQVVPSEITRSYLREHSGGYWYFPEFDHHCCWREAWPKILHQGHKKLSF